MVGVVLADDELCFGVMVNIFAATKRPTECFFGTHAVITIAPSVKSQLFDVRTLKSH